MNTDRAVAVLALFFGKIGTVPNLDVVRKVIAILTLRNFLELA